MKSTSETCFCIVDHGLFLSVARRLAKSAKRVLYHTPWEKGFSTLNDFIIGDGFENVELCEDIWKVKKEVDCFVFPDIQHSGLQLELESQGFAVWGSRNGDSLELNREKFNRVLKQLGLPVAPFVVVNGLTELRKHLWDKTDKYIKISKYRGTMETWHWRDKTLDSGRLDALAVKLGPFQDHMPFLVVDAIDCEIEVGGDTYCVDGYWPSMMLCGLENKDRCYLAEVKNREEMPQELVDIIEAFSPQMNKLRYRNQWSMETRDGRFIDPTCRGGLPSTASQLNTWENFPEIVLAGANGKCLDPIPKFKFSSEAILSLNGKKDDWGKIVIPPELSESVQLASCCEIDGAICFPPDGHEGEDVGWLVAGGETMEEAIEELNRLADLLPDGLTAATVDLIELVRNMRKAEDAGNEVSSEAIPEPETVVS